MAMTINRFPHYNPFQHRVNARGGGGQTLPQTPTQTVRRGRWNVVPSCELRSIASAWFPRYSVKRKLFIWVNLPGSSNKQLFSPSPLGPSKGYKIVYYLETIPSLFHEVCPHKILPTWNESSSKRVKYRAQVRPD